MSLTCFFPSNPASGFLSNKRSTKRNAYVKSKTRRLSSEMSRAVVLADRRSFIDILAMLCPAELPTVFFTGSLQWYCDGN